MPSKPCHSGLHAHGKLQSLSLENILRSKVFDQRSNLCSRKLRRLSSHFWCIYREWFDLLVQRVKGPPLIGKLGFKGLEERRLSFSTEGDRSMEGNIMSWVLPGVVLWAAAFVVVRRALPRRSFDFCNRVVSTIHATLAVCLAMHSVQDWRCPVCPLGSRSSLLQMRALSVTLSYLIYDAICGLFDKKVSLENLVHHTVGIVGIGAGLAYERCGTEMVATLWVTEISSPFLHLRELLKEVGYRDSDLNLAVDILFAAIFSFARMVCGPYIVTVTVLADYPLLIKGTALGLQLVSTFWFYKIVRMVVHKMTKKRRQTKVI